MVADVPIYNMTDIWNDGLVIWYGIKLDVTNSGSAAGSMLMQLGIGGVPMFQVDKTGIVKAAAGFTPIANDTGALGTTALSFADLFLATGGVVNWNAGDVTITHAANSLAFAGAANGYTFDSILLPTQLSVGHTANLSIGGNADTFEIVGTTATSGLALAMFSATPATSGHLDFYKSANAAIGSATVVTSGERLGAINFFGAQQTGTFATQNPAAQIRSEVDGTVTSGAGADMPGRLVLSTTADGSGTVTDRLILDSAGVLKPNANDGVALGTTALSFADLFLASGAVLNFNAGNYTVTHTAGLLTTSGALTLGGAFIGTTGTFSGVVKPSANDGAALGVSGTAWADLFLADAAVINFNAGNYTMTNLGTTLTFSGGITVQGTVLMSPANLNVTMQPSGTGTVTINPATTGSMNNMNIGSSTRGSVQGTTGNFNSTLDVTGTLTASNALNVNGAFTSLGIDDNATGERLEIADTVTKIGSATAASGYNFARVVNDGYLSIDGGNTGNAGANLLMIGGTHATLAFDWALQHAAVPVLGWDDSAGTFTFSNSAAAVLASIVTGTAIFNGDLRTGGMSVVSTPGSGNNLSGACFTNNVLFCSTAGNSNLNRTADGVVLTVTGGGVTQGVVTIAGATVTWGTFTGSHWSQLAGNGAPIDIYRGSIVDTIDELCQWLAFTYTDHDGIEHTNDKDAYPESLEIGDTFEFTYERDEMVDVVHVDKAREVETTEINEPYQDFEVVDGFAVVIQRYRRKQMPIIDYFPAIDAKGASVMEDAPVIDELGNQLVDHVPVRKGSKKTKAVPRTEPRQVVVAVPRSIEVERKTVKQERQTVTYKATATIVELRNDSLARFEVSKTDGSERPYGVFGWWARDYGENDNDAYIIALGTYPVRVGAQEKIKGGDLIESAGDGTGRVMRDDSLSAIKVAKRHVATITAAVPIAIHPFGPMHYPDGSRLFPATIHCG